jgi:hypothetical protein
MQFACLPHFAQNDGSRRGKQKARFLSEAGFSTPDKEVL